MQVTPPFPVLLATCPVVQFEVCPRFCCAIFFVFHFRALVNLIKICRFKNLPTIFVH
jgi:hypothetical protein